MDTRAISPTFLGTWSRATQDRRMNSFVLWPKSWGVFSIHYPPPPPSTYLASDTAQCLLLLSLFSLVLLSFLGLLSHDSAASRSLERQRFPQDVRSTKDGQQLCSSKTVKQSNLPYQAFFILGDSVPITMGSIVTFVTIDSFTFERYVLIPFHLLHLSSNDILVHWPSYVSVCHFCVPLCTTVISGQLYLSRLSGKALLSQVILFSALCIC